METSPDDLNPQVLGDSSLYDRSIVQFSMEWLAPLLEALDAFELVAPFESDHYSIYREQLQWILHSHLIKFKPSLC